METTIEEMRESLILFEKRELRINAFRTESQTERNIKEWLKMPDDKIKIWYNKFFENN